MTEPKNKYVNQQDANQDDQEKASTDSSKQTFVVKLKKPIKSGSRIISEVTVYEPFAGELVGINMFALQFGNMSVVRQLLPRITEPRLRDADLNKMCGADCLKLASAITGFLFDPSDIFDLQTIQEDLQAQGSTQ